MKDIGEGFVLKLILHLLCSSLRAFLLKGHCSLANIAL